MILAAVAGLAIGMVLAFGAGSHRSTPALTTPMAERPGTQSRKVVAAVSQPKRKILYYWDPMVGPASISPKPGISSMGMALIPVYAPAGGASVPGEVRVDPAMVQDMGFQTGNVTLGPLNQIVRTVGYLRVAAPNRYAVTVRAGGWIGKLYATTNGTAIKKGQKLFTFYSPRIVAAEEELVAAQKALLATHKTPGQSLSDDARQLVKSVALRLSYLGVNQSQIRNVEKSLHARNYVTFYSPADGVLTDVAVQQKSRINSGTTALRIENLSALWLDTYVYENQLQWIRLGQRVTATIAAFPGRIFQGKIIFIDSFENPENHTTVVRIALGNSTGELRPGMYALADIHTNPIQHAILIPRRAVIHTGTGELVFVEISQGHFDPVKVTTGLTGENGLVQVLSGVGPGQQVLTSGQFAIDVESDLNAIKARFMPNLPRSKPGEPKPKNAKPGGRIGSGPPG
jgi:RND family efflux transporter MFP subunit